jgi:hypothetical protein
MIAGASSSSSALRSARLGKVMRAVAARGGAFGFLTTGLLCLQLFFQISK